MIRFLRRMFVRPVIDLQWNPRTKRWELVREGQAGEEKEGKKALVQKDKKKKKAS